MKNEQNPLMKEKLGPLKNSKNEENVTHRAVARMKATVNTVTDIAMAATVPASVPQE